MSDTIIWLTKEVAKAQHIQAPLLLALVEQESGFDPWAVRYEPAFYERYVSPLVANGNLSKTESRLRAFSFGLCQIMGQTAREHGYTEALPKLFDPTINLELGCTIFRAMLRRVGGDLTLALLRWNGGGRPAYAQEVRERMEKWA